MHWQKQNKCKDAKLNTGACYYIYFFSLFFGVAWPVAFFSNRVQSRRFISRNCGNLLSMFYEIELEIEKKNVCIMSFGLNKKG